MSDFEFGDGSEPESLEESIEMAKAALDTDDVTSIAVAVHSEAHGVETILSTEDVSTRPSDDDEAVLATLLAFQLAHFSQEFGLDPGESSEALAEMATLAILSQRVPERVGSILDALDEAGEVPDE